MVDMVLDDVMLEWTGINRGAFWGLSAAWCRVLFGGKRGCCFNISRPA